MSSGQIYFELSRANQSRRYILYFWFYHRSFHSVRLISPVIQFSVLLNYKYLYFLEYILIERSQGDLLRKERFIIV